MKNFFGEAVNWIGGAIEDAGEIAGDVTTFVAGLPNELVGWADRISASQARATSEARSAATEFQIQRALGRYGPVIAIGGLALAVALLAGK